MQDTVTIGREAYEAGISDLRQLEALLVSASGLGFDHFMSMSPELQDRLIMLALRLVRDSAVSLTPR
jgi:hypothetical protein